MKPPNSSDEQIEALRAGLALLLDRSADVLEPLGPGGYLLPSGAARTNALEAAVVEARTVLASIPASGVVETEELTQTMQRALPGGGMDDATYERVEEALDRAGAPICSEDGGWLPLDRRVAALAAAILSLKDEKR